MNRHKHIVLLFCAALPLVSLAQPSDNNDAANSGQIELGGGLGAATPWSAGFKGEFGNKLKLMPMLHINGINRNSSSQDETQVYTYTGIMPLSQNAGYGYQSQANNYSKGVNFDYGLSARYLINPRNTLTASVKGNLLRLDNYGTLTEYIFAPGLNHPTHTPHSVINGSTHKGDIEVAAGYRHLTKLTPGFSDGFALDYTYTRETEELKRQQDSHKEAAFPDDVTSRFFDLNTEGISAKHRVQGTWMQHFGTVQFHLAAFFEDRLLTSTDHQVIDVTALLPIHNIQDEEFRHRYNTTGAFLMAATKIKNVTLNARLEYDYTYMEGHHLSDFLPTASVEWAINSRNQLTARYVRRLIRPSLELLNPAKVNTNYTCHYGNEELIGMHVNNFMLTHNLRQNRFSLTSTLQHIFSNDGFNALWMERNLIRNYTWGNEGKRRAYLLTEVCSLQPADGTKLTAQATVAWDKRIAEAIHMQKEHWGVSAQLGVEQRVAKRTVLSARGQYAEGNTVDLYSHEGRSFGVGATVRQDLTDRMVLTLGYDFRDEPKLMITQGAYTGAYHNRHANRHAVTLNYSYKF